MSQRVHLDAMIPRADFAVIEDEPNIELFQNFAISNLEPKSPVQSLLRKPDFQRETNHWTPTQVAAFICSFLDGELIPSLILWRSPAYLFVIDGGHRLSALRAWMEDDYGDGPLSRAFFGDISREQRKAASRTRRLVEDKVGRFTELRELVNQPANPTDIKGRRSRILFTRGLNLQWVQGDATVAESSFFKINSQGTPLDDTEEMLLRNRNKGISIGARAILRASSGHKYWSRFSGETQRQIEDRARQLFELVFQPEAAQPIKTLDLPLGGSTAPVDALAMLIETLVITDTSCADERTARAQLRTARWRTRTAIKR